MAIITMIVTFLSNTLGKTWSAVFRQTGLNGQNGHLQNGLKIKWPQKSYNVPSQNIGVYCSLLSLTTNAAATAYV